MTIKQVNKFHKDYEKILLSKQSKDEKALKFSALMTEMERTFKIPIIQNKQYEQSNKSIIALYRKISMSRSL